MPVDLVFHKEINEKSNLVILVINLNAMLKKEGKVKKNATLNV